jgi:predicted nucleotidyltransferase
MTEVNKIVLSAVVGSVAYGLNHSASDVDTMSVFLAPTVNVAGLYWGSKDESWSTAGPVGDDDSAHEVGKFLRLVLKSNPTMLELLFMNEYTVLDEVGQGMVDIRSKMLYTKAVQNAYLGYAIAQKDRVLREYPDHKPKMIRHCLRIAEQGTDLLSTGTFNVRVDDPDRFFRLDTLPLMEVGMILENALYKLENVKSVLPDEPDVQAVDNFLKDVRRNNIG